RVDIPAGGAIMGPVAPERIGIEVQRAGVLQDVTGRRRVGDETIHVDIAVAVGEVDSCGIAVTRDQASAPDINAGLDADHLAAGARVGEGLVVVVDLLTEQTAPDGLLPAVIRSGRSSGDAVSRFPAAGRGSIRAGRVQPRIADPLV